MIRILLVPDVEGWAWWWMAKGLQRYQPKGVEFSVVTQQQFGVLTGECQHLLSQFNAVLQYSWTEATLSGKDSPVPLPRNCTLLASHGAEFHYPPLTDTIPERIATGLRNRKRAMSNLHRFQNVLCVSSRLKDVADKMIDVKAVLTLPGVDHRFFQFMEIPDREEIVVGWCGQSRGVTKGYDEVLVPLMERGIPGIRFEVNDRHAGDALSQKEMRQWYHGIDVLLSTSCSEGFQMPPLEAMSCGRPVIATDCGGIPELVIDGTTGWILPGWSTESEAATAVDGIDDILRGLRREEVSRRGLESRQRVDAEFSWTVRAEEWTRAILG